MVLFSLRRVSKLRADTCNFNTKGAHTWLLVTTAAQSQDPRGHANALMISAHPPAAIHCRSTHEFYSHVKLFVSGAHWEHEKILPHLSPWQIKKMHSIRCCLRTPTFVCVLGFFVVCFCFFLSLSCAAILWFGSSLKERPKQSRWHLVGRTLWETGATVNKLNLS